VQTVKVKAKFFAALREITGVKEENLEMREGSTIEDLLAALTRKFGEQFKNYVFDDKTGALKGHLQFLLDGRNIASKEGLQTRLGDGAQFAIIPPVGGG